MSKNNTFARVVLSLCAFFISVQAADAQSVLNFVRVVQNGNLTTGIAVTNPSSYFADVQFSFYGLDGGLLTSGLVNPVAYRVPPKGQIAMATNEIFGSSQTQGWIQATSVTSGLAGTYFSGDFDNILEGSEPASPMSAQIIPFLEEDPAKRTDVLITNPGPQRASVNLTFYNARGIETGTFSSELAPHAQVGVIPSGVWARVSSSVPVLAAGVVQAGDSLLLINGQPLESASTRIVPHFVSGSGVDGALVLVNPTAFAATVSVRLFNENGSAPLSATVVVPGNGSTSVDAHVLTGLLIPPTIGGWLRVDSPNTQLNGIAILDSGAGLTALPVQSSGLDRFLFSQIPDSQALFTGLTLVNASAASVALDVTLIGSTGSTVAQRTLAIGPNSKLTNLVREFAAEAPDRSGFLAVRASAPLYSVELLGSPTGNFLTALSPQRLPAGFTPGATDQRPRIVRIEPGTDIHPGARLQISVANFGPDVSFVFDAQVVSGRTLSPISSTFIVDVPQAEFGYVNLKVRSGGVESDPIPLRLTPADASLMDTVSGRAFYQKVEVSDSGLDTSRTIMVPIRHARVEVIDRSLQTVVSVSESDDRGQFQVAVPYEPDLTIRVVSRLRPVNLQVVDNTSGNTPYVISRDVDMREQSSSLLLVDTTRLSGAFNIMEMIERGNELVHLADASIAPPSFTVFWSTRNTNRTGNIREGLVGGTYFNLSTNTAFVLGDRAVDSDEFDDSVIIHEYAHMLAVRFSRDDSPGSAHGVGDILDPRVAWSEGLANFFSSLARNDAIYRDSSGPNGINVLRYDLEDNTPPGDQPGYWSEASVQSLLWDLSDDVADRGDAVQFPFASVWAAFVDLRQDRFVYLPYFLEHFIARNPSQADVVRNMALLRSIDFQPGVRPSVTNAFPRPMNVGDSVTGEVDSATLRRTNLMQSAHFWSFTTTGGAFVIRMDIVGLGSGGNPNANDLDLFLLDADGRIIERSDRGLNGQSELISTRLPAGSYVLEVRSFYSKAETNAPMFSSGRYRLNLLIQ